MKIWKYNRRLLLNLAVVVTLCLALVVGGTVSVFAVSDPAGYDLTTDNPTEEYLIHGAWWFRFQPDWPTGSGVFNSFFRERASGSEMGYNTDHRPLQFDELKSKTFTHSVLLNDVPQVFEKGGIYREFQLDINENKGEPDWYLSLDKFQVWTTDNPEIFNYNPVTYSFPTNPADPDYAQLVYDLDGDGDTWIMLDYRANPGSGKRDYRVIVPESAFAGKEMDYCVIFAEHGSQDGVWTSDDGYEEWGVAMYPAIKSGIKFEDKNANQSYDAGDVPLGGWEIRVYADEDGDGMLQQTEYDAGPVATYTTDAGTGAYSFTLDPGKYIVVEVMDTGDGWIQSFPTTGVLDGVTPVGETLGSNGYAVDLGNGALDMDNDFGNWRTATKSGVKFEDLDADGQPREAGEPGLGGWTIYVDLNDNGSFDGGEPSAVTAGDGTYTITGITPSPTPLKVREVVKPGWTQSYPASGYHEETFTSGAAFSGNDFGNWRPATKSGVKFEDLDADGQPREAGEPGMGGWTIYVDLNDNGGFDGGEPSAVTAGDGTYTITGITPSATPLKVREVVKPGWTQSYPASGYHEETFTSGGAFSGNDFGNWTTGTKSGHKYNDLNGNGNISEDTSNPLSGWEIRAYVDSNDNGLLDQGEYNAGPADTDNTAVSTGAYLLTLDPGKYIVVEVLQNNWFQSYPAGNVLAGGLDTGLETLGANGYVIEVQSRSSEADNDFGNYQEADLELTKTGTITYTITVTNNGPSTAFNVVVDDDLPGDLNWVITSAPAGFTITGNHLHGTIPSLASGNSIVIVVEATIDSDSASPILPNTAVTSSDTPDQNTDNNSDDANIGPTP